MLHSNEKEQQFWPDVSLGSKVFYNTKKKEGRMCDHGGNI